MALKAVTSVKTAPIVAAGMIGGYLTARETGLRSLGGAVLGLAGAYAGRTWLAKRSPGIATVLSAIYVGGFGVSHPLAKKIGAWPAVLTVTGIASAAAYALADYEESLE